MGRRTLMTRLVSVHKDNPFLWDDDRQEWTPRGKAYMAKLHAMHGATKERMLYGRWISESGLIWENFHPNTHMVDFQSEVDDGRTRDEQGRLVFRWFFASKDWGSDHPGVLNVWGVDAAHRMVRVVEVHRRRKGVTWWTNVAVELAKEFWLQAIVCDKARPELIDHFNDHLSRVPGAPEGQAIAIQCDNDWDSGRSMVEHLLDPDDEGIPRLAFCRDAMRYGVDPDLLEASQPTSTPKEIAAYVWRKDDSGKVRRKEGPDPRCKDDGCDTTRYAAKYAWNADLTPRWPDRAKYRPGSYGDILRHAEVLQGAGGPKYDPTLADPWKDAAESTNELWNG